MPQILPVFIPFAGCSSKCIYCNQNSITGIDSSNLLNDVSKQVEFYLSFKRKWDEISFFGGSFSCLPEDIRKKLYNLANINGFKSIRFSTRPDCINDEMIEEFKQSNVKVIELGVQSLSDNVLINNKRPYKSETALSNIKKLSDNGFYVVAQIMVGMYKETLEDFKFTISKLLEAQIKGVRIYPNVVLKDTLLFKYYKNNKFKPLNFEETILRTSHSYIRFCAKKIDILRVGLHNSKTLNDDIVAGVYYPAFGDMVKSFIVVLYFKFFDYLKIRQTDINKLANYNGIIKKYFSDRIVFDSNAKEFEFYDICRMLESKISENNWGKAEREVAEFAKEVWCKTNN